MPLNAPSLRRIWRPDQERKTRFHTARGDLSVDPAQLGFAFTTTVMRHAFGYLLPIPWLTLPAVRYFRARAWEDATVFEYSSGMSTLWYARHFRSVWAVENQREWFERVRSMCAKYQNTQLYLKTDKTGYVNAIEQTSESEFDVISIDGSFRYECFVKGISYLRKGGIMVIDNSDIADHAEIMDRIPEFFEHGNTLRFPGYASGNFHATETTICVKS